MTLDYIKPPTGIARKRYREAKRQERKEFRKKLFAMHSSLSNPYKDRSLAGKKRIRARRAAA